MALKSLFFPKTCKKSRSGWGLRPQAPIASAGWGLRPQTPSVMRFSYTSLLENSSNLAVFHFLTFGLSSLFLAKSWLSPKHRPWLLIFHSTISKSHKKFFFPKFLMTSLRVICGLSPSQSKILVTLMVKPFHSGCITDCDLKILSVL